MIDTVEPLGDSAFLIRLESMQQALDLVRALTQARPSGLRDAAAAYDCVALYYDPLATTRDALADLVRERLRALAASSPTAGHVVRIPVTYDGPDLDAIAERTKLSRDAVIAAHSGREYTVQAVGFVPGFAYLGDLDHRLRLPRRDSPRPRVAAGSVAIAGAQTAVYPFSTPGGWHLLGRTAVVMFDPERSPPALLSVGTRVRFDPT